VRRAADRRVDAFRRRIRRHEDLNAFISLTDESGEGPAVAVKDLIDVRGTVTTAGGKLLPEVPAPDDAPVIKRLRGHGGFVIGKTNLHEWAFGPTSVNPHFGPVRNPHDPARIAGGSSGGSAVAVALDLCDWAIGTDTGGSIRIPSALCGVVGLKPSLGAIATGGIVPLSRSLDTVGPLAKDVATTAAAFGVLAGRDLTGVRPSESPRIAVPAGWAVGLDERTSRAWRLVTEGLPKIAFPEPERLAGPGRTILYYEAAKFHARWLGDPSAEYGADVRGYLEEGARIPRSDYLAAVRAAARLCRDAEDALDDVDAMLVPATACVAPVIGSDDQRGPLTRFTRPFNTTGHPVITIPAPAGPGLPVGMQLVGHLNDELGLIRTALAVEKAWRSRQEKSDGQAGS
jgi:aspartyl-tRNA(Asn)/glutamyl-tRNA(Gln) amidotransferase subunit A